MRFVSFVSLVSLVAVVSVVSPRELVHDKGRASGGCLPFPKVVSLSCANDAVSYNTLDNGTPTEGRYIGGVLDKSAPTEGWVKVFITIIDTNCSRGLAGPHLP
jgi:hypothetical protein